MRYVFIYVLKFELVLEFLFLFDIFRIKGLKKNRNENKNYFVILVFIILNRYLFVF